MGGPKKRTPILFFGCPLFWTILYVSIEWDVITVLGQSVSRHFVIQPNDNSAHHKSSLIVRHYEASW